MKKIKTDATDWIDGPSMFIESLVKVCRIRFEIPNTGSLNNGLVTLSYLKDHEL